MRETARLASQWKLNYKMSKYRKLVRDRIPEIIKENGGVPQTRILTKKEFKEELLKKLVEEAKEASKSAIEKVKKIGGEIQLGKKSNKLEKPTK